MNDLLFELNKCEVPSWNNDTYYGVALNNDAISKYKNDLETLFRVYFSKIDDYINTLSIHKNTSVEIAKYISLQKEKFELFRRNKNEIGKKYGLDTLPLTVSVGIAFNDFF